MTILPEQLIVSRLLPELKGAERVALGPGLPQSLKPFLNSGIEWLDLGPEGGPFPDVDIAVVEALEVSEKGDLAAAFEIHLDGFISHKWIVAGRIERSAGESLMVKNCRFPVQIRGGVDLIVTELGVISLGPVGFELKELAPGVASDQVRQKVKASLHVADGIERLKLDN